MSKILPRALGLAAVLLAALPCRAYTPDPPPVIEVTDTQTEGSAFLILETYPSGADVYLDRVFIGRTPHDQRGVVPGLHVLRFELAGHRSRELVLDLAEKRTYTIQVILVPRTGRLSVSVTPTDARVSVDGSELSGSLAEVPAGIRTVRASRFGYEEAVQNVFVPEDGIASAAFVLEPAPFTLSELRLKRPSFNPANTGPLGLAEIRFTVTSFGRAELEIRDSGGERVARIPVPPFDRNVQILVWDGRGPDGRPLPDGEYSLELRAFPEDPGTDPSEFVRRGILRVDSTFLVAPRGLSGGLSGLALFPDPFTDPGRLLRFHGAVRPAFTPAGVLDGSFISLGAQTAFGPAGEAALQGSFDPGDADSGSLGAGLKLTLVRADRFQAAAFAAAALGSPGGDPVAVPPARLGFSAALGSLRAYGGLALELEVPSWADPAPVLAARAGAALAGGRFGAGLSAAIRTEALAGGFALDGTIRTALEARAFLAPLPLALGLCLGVDFDVGGLSALRTGLELSLTF
ncbi:MAG TPA: PEGA domain-containing protein [Spirochaetales bacterium]|nr:PEGA domain-containing protein [Spirochaetales bacterium]